MSLQREIADGVKTALREDRRIQEDQKATQEAMESSAAAMGGGISAAMYLIPVIPVGFLFTVTMKWMELLQDQPLGFIYRWVLFYVREGGGMQNVTSADNFVAYIGYGLAFLWAMLWQGATLMIAGYILGAIVGIFKRGKGTISHCGGAGACAGIILVIWVPVICFAILWINVGINWLITR